MFHFPSFFKHVLAASHSLFAVSMEPSCERLLGKFVFRFTVNESVVWTLQRKNPLLGNYVV